MNLSEGKGLDQAARPHNRRPSNVKGHRQPVQAMGPLTMPDVTNKVRKHQTPLREPWEGQKRAFRSWLTDRGVSSKWAKTFIDKTKCDCPEEAAIYLRFQLPPLHLANNDSVNRDMKKLLGCNAKVALRVISDLDVFSAPPSSSVLLLLGHNRH
jgi:hypothetical protein